MIHDPLEALALIVAVGVAAQWIAMRFHLPAILLLLLAGFALGPGLQVLDPDLVFGELLLPFVSVAVALILFEGGLSLDLRELRATGRMIRNLVTIGAAVTWAGGAVAAHLLLDWSWTLSILLGAILTVTGPTVIGPLLEHVRPSGRTGAILRWEGILIDPIGALLALLVFEVAIAADVSHAVGVLALSVARTLLVGGGVGLAGALLVVVLLRRYLIPDPLHTAVSLAVVVGAFVGANALQEESGLVAVTVMGIAMATQKAAPVKRIIEFKENLRVLLLSGLFIALAARLRRDDIAQLGPQVLAFLGVVIFLLRPAAVAVSAIGTGLTWRERLLISWVAPRGIVAAAVASIFALRLAGAGYPSALRLVPVVFAVIVATITVYATTLGWVARRLGLAEPPPQGVLIVGAHTAARALAASLREAGRRVVLADTDHGNVTAARMAGLDAHYGSALSENAGDELDLTGVGYLLALTSNDEVNSLAVQHFAQRFGRRNVYQLVPKLKAGRHREALAPWLRGRLLFDGGLTLDELEGHLENGGTIRRTRLTAEFGFEDLKRTHRDLVPLLVLGEDGDLAAFAEDAPPTPRAGQTVLALVGHGGDGAERPPAG